MGTIYVLAMQGLQACGVALPSGLRIKGRCLPCNEYFNKHGKDIAIITKRRPSSQAQAVDGFACCSEEAEEGEVAHILPFSWNENEANRRYIKNIVRADPLLTSAYHLAMNQSKDIE
ncbi:hypothetical protein FSST1_007143 [Fusarium sambucinum]